jgi:ABC-type transporter Mla subunit MlaD
MAVPTNHFKLGLFVLLGVVAAIALVIGLGAQNIRRDTVRYHTFFDESVQGLDVGAPVKYRGVTIGAVGALAIAPDHRLVDVALDLSVDEIHKMGLAEQSGLKAVMKGTLFRVPPDLRTQLGTQGITGVKFVTMDFFDPKTTPPPSLSFPPPDNYIPAAPSTLKSLEDTLTRAMEKLPDVVNSMAAIMIRVDHILSDFQGEDLPEKVGNIVLMMRGVIHQLQSAELPQKLGSSVDAFGQAVDRLSALIERADSDGGILTSIRHASDSFGRFGRGAGAATRDLDQTLREVRAAAETVRRFGEDLEQQPDILVKGRSKAKRRDGPE